MCSNSFFRLSEQISEKKNFCTKIFFPSGPPLGRLFNFFGRKIKFSRMLFKLTKKPFWATFGEKIFRPKKFNFFPLVPLGTKKIFFEIFFLPRKLFQMLQKQFWATFGEIFFPTQNFEIFLASPRHMFEWIKRTKTQEKCTEFHCMTRAGQINLNSTHFNVEMHGIRLKRVKKAKLRIFGKRLIEDRGRGRREKFWILWFSVKISRNFVNSTWNFEKKFETFKFFVKISWNF